MNRQKKLQSKGGKVPGGARLFSSPYFPGQDPDNDKKPLIYANVNAVFSTKGLDGGKFDWGGVFGKDQDGKTNKAQIVFEQIDYDTSTRTGVKFFLKVDKDGTYTWSDDQGKPTKLPLYSKELKPFKYEVLLDEDVSDHVKLLTARFFGTREKYYFGEPDPVTGEIVGTINLDLSLQQIASTKFTSKWNTGVEEADRPTVEGSFLPGNETDPEMYGIFKFPSNDTGKTIIRNDQLDPNNPGEYSEYRAADLEKTPKVDVADPDPDSTDTYVLDRDNKKISYKEKTYRYTFTYDVINGGKLTMTEIIPVTFDANGGKFASITEEGADQKIVKEVDYDGTLTDKAEEPTQDRETFKGWSTTTDGKTPATDADFKNITKAKTFYAIWVNNPITAEELTVNESFKEDGTTEYVNDFIPPLDTLKGQVKIKDANGDPQPLAADDTFEILKDDGQTAFTQAEIDDGTLKDYLYEKLKEKDNPKGEPTRVETVKAKVTYANGTSRTVDIPIKVIKNIYEAKTKEGKPIYVPGDYVKVTLDPTKKATDPQKIYYYVNPAAKVVIPGEDPTGTDGNVFAKWTMKADTASGEGADYTLRDRHQFAAASTIEAQYEKEKQGIINIKYVDENGKEIDSKYHVDGVDYPSTKEGKSGALATEKEYPTPGPAFKGYIYTSRDAIKSQHYNDPATDTITYQYTKKVTTDDKSTSWVYFPVVFDANGGEFKSDTATQKTVYVYFDGNDATVEKVTFKEVKDEFEKAYSNPTKDGFDFKEWQNAKTNGTKPADDYEIQFKGWDWEADPDNGYVPETFYAHYEQASALVKYLDLDGKPIADEFKIDGVEYPTEKEGKLGEAIASDVFTKDNAPKLIGYKFNRIELNPVNSKYALDNKATIKIYYEKLPDVIPAKDGSGNPNEKPEGYVEVKFVPTDKAKDTTEKIFYVNPKKDVTIPIADPEAKATYTFKEWKMGADAKGAVYTPSTGQKFTDDLTVITATYEETKNIIPYDPSVPDPMVRPEGYVRVTFAADMGLKLTEQKAYYVKKNAGITLGNADLVKPAYKEETGYKFKEWDKEDTLTIAEADILVTAKATKLDPVIPEKDGEGNPNDKPEGYKEVTFVVKIGDEAKGKVTGVAKFYVNPTEYVTINPPATKANTGYEFGAWDKDATIPTVYKEDTTITGSFNGLKDVIPKTKDDDSEKPAGYVKVTFELEKLDGKEAGKIVDGETITYFVKPNTDVTIPQPGTLVNTGYEFKTWNPDTSKKAQYSQDTTVKGNFKKLENIIPSKKDDGTPNAKPDGYITVTFDKGDHGKDITGKTVYYVNPKADPLKKLGDTLIKKPTVKAETGYKFTGWDTKDDFEIKADKTVKAKYDSIDDVVPKTKDDESEKPEDYITVTFVKGEHGKELTGQAVYYVNPNKAVVLKEKAPTAVPNTGYKFARWDVSIDQAIQYKDGAEITALYNDPGNISTTEVASYVKVEFKPGTNGALEGTQAYWIKPGVEVNIPAPAVKPNVGYKFDKWDKSLTVTAKAGDPTYEITATYTEKATIIPKTKSDDSEKPNGYVTVTFTTDGNGSLEGTTTYFVNPNKEADFTQIADNLTKKPNIGYTEKGGSWNSTDFKKTFNANAEFKFGFKKLEDVIPAKEGEDRPEGYVTVKLIPTDKATVATEKSYWVKADTEVTITDKPMGTKVKDANDITYDYTFAGWTVTRGTIASWNDENIKGKFIQDTEITAKYNLKLVDVMPLPLAQDNVVTPIGETPDVNTLIKNKDKLPENTTINYATGGEPSVDKAGKTTAKVEVKYPNGKTTIVEVPITVVNNVIPKVDENTKKPDGYVMVTFEIEGKGGTIADGETTVYYVNPKQDVTIPQPDTIADTGYMFDKWDKDTKTPTKYLDETTVKGSFKSQKDIIPATNDDGTKNDKPEGYVTLTFDKGEQGKEITGQRVYYVNPKTDPAKMLGDTLIKKPEVKAATGWKQKADADAWDTPDTFEITADKTVKAQYEPLADVIPQEKEDGTDKPDGYISVTFSTETNGKIEGTDKTTRVIYVNPNKAVVLNDQAPKVTPNTGFEFADWDTQIEKAIQYKDKDVIKAKYNTIGDVIPQGKPDGSDKPAGYLTVTFVKGNHGELNGQTVYYVKPSTEVTVPAPAVTPASGWKHEGWDKALTQTFTEDTTITAQYDSFGDIIPQEKTDGSDKPDGYVTVTFNKGANGSLEGQTVYYVNPTAGKTLADVIHPTIKPATGFTSAGWDKEDTTAITGDITVTAKYQSENDVIPKTKDDGTENDKPEGYITVTFEKGEHGRLNGKTVYYVNPKKAVVLKDQAPDVTPDKDYTFTGWDTTIEKAIQYKDGDKITAKYTEKETKPGRRSGGSSGGSGGVLVPSTPKPTPEKPSEGDLNKDDHYQYLIGYPDGTFAPNRGMTRAEVATMFTRLLKDRPVKWLHYSSGLSDIYAGDWYADTVGYAVEKGIVSGYPDGTFRPNQPITRAEFASIASRFAALTEEKDLSFSDLDASHWGYKAIRLAASNGWISGYPDNTFRPEKAISRAEVTSITNRMLNRYADLDWIDAHRAEVIRFSDVGRSDWFFEPVMEATMGHDFTRDKDGKAEHWTGLNGKTFI
ncbi:S-layer homology domain-containing protein [Peptococcus niger]|uniref:S-layer homology domain-containing protein n=1 Tax=Peptococcus niger TaxID=2741 RepID=UPI0013565AA5|nr:S-layer homology domain-containing protein [Peptococcus niger]